MSSLHSAPSQRSSDEERGSEILYDMVSSDDHVSSDSESVVKTLETSRSSSESTTMLMRRAPRNIGSWTMPILMLGSYLIAAAVIVAHHIFLHVLDGKSVQDFSIPQTWVRDIGNALARIVQILLETSVGVALTQSIWFYARRSTVTVPELDDLFALPSIAGISFTTLRLSALYVLPIAVNIQAFSLVSIFAPNALSVVPSSPISSVLSVPFPALDKIAVPDSARTLAADYHGDLRTYVSPSTGFNTLVQYVLSKGDILPWSTPAGCGLACNYSIVYHAPSLRCRDIAPSSIALYSNGSSLGTLTSGTKFTLSPVTSEPDAVLDLTNVYNATSTLGYVHTRLEDTPVSTSYVTTPENDLYSITLAYSTGSWYWYPAPGTLFGGSLTSQALHFNGSSCVFVNATYSVSVQFANGTQIVNARISEYGEPYQSLTDGSNILHTQNLSTIAMLGLMDAMTRYLVGTATLDNSTSSSNTQILQGAALFTVQIDDNTVGLYPAEGRNISQTLEDLCTNLTASLMSDTANLGIRTSVPATVLPDKTIYEYQPSRLWLVYGIALGVALIADLFGLACMRSNGVAMLRNFSSIAASMRAPELNELLNGPEESPQASAKVAKLRYRVGDGELGEKSGFRIVEGADEVRMGEVKALDEER